MRRRREKRASARRLFEVCWVIGIPQSGKTTLAVSRAVAKARERGVPLFAIDGANVAQLRGFPARSSVLEAIEASFGRGEDSRVRPRTLEELDALLRGIRAGKRAVVLVDEAHRWLSAQSGSSGELLALMRETQHSEVDLFCTTQHLTGDVPQAAISCTARVLVFRNVAEVVLERCDKSWKLPRETVANLPQFHYLERVIGFQPPSSRRNGPPPPVATPEEDDKRAPLPCRRRGSERARAKGPPGPSSRPGSPEHDGTQRRGAA